MLSRSAGRAIVESPWRLPPTFLLPLRARLLSTATQSTAERDLLSTTAERDLLSMRGAAAAAAAPIQPSPSSPNSTIPAEVLRGSSLRQQISPVQSVPASAPASPNSRPYTTTTAEAAAAPAAATTTAAATTNDLSTTTTAAAAASTTNQPPYSPLSDSVRELLPLLAAQRPHYATVHIHARAYMVTEGDVVRLPFRMPGVSPGDVLRLDRASLVGSRDFTLRGQPWVDGRLYECRAVVASVEAEPMRLELKTKRRNRRVKTVRSKHRYTEIAIRELKIRDAAEIEQ